MANLAFFGTPEFSLPSLRAVHRFCLDHGHQLKLVVCQSDRQQGRGQRVSPPPVKKLALELGITVAQPTTLKKGSDDGDQFFTLFSHLNIDLSIVVAYGRILTERLLAKSTCGFVNVHASLLPRFRGAAPVQRAIEYGDKETGVCLMDVVKALDEGDIYAVRKTPIMPCDTGETLFRRLANMGACLLADKLPDLLLGRLKKLPQAKDGVVYAHSLEKDEGKLNFNLPGKTISQKVMAFDPWPGAFGYIRERRVKFFDSFFIKADIKDRPPGTVVVAGEFLGVIAADGIVYFQGMQVEGKRAMPIKDAALGFPNLVGERISGTSSDFDGLPSKFPSPAGRERD